MGTVVSQKSPRIAAKVLIHIAMVSSVVISHVRAGPVRYYFTNIFRIKREKKIFPISVKLFIGQ